MPGQSRGLKGDAWETGGEPPATAAFPACPWLWLHEAGLLWPRVPLPAGPLNTPPPPTPPPRFGEPVRSASNSGR